MFVKKKSSFGFCFFYYIILIILRFEDLQFRQKITNCYLEDRAEIRRTGKTANMQQLDKYKKWKEHQT